MSAENIDEYKNNEDQYPNMEESLVPDFENITNRKNGDSDVNIQVCNPTVRDEKFKKYVVYAIKGSDKNGSFDVIRRYSDFDRIRSLLVTRWPGCYIPPLPPKSMSNMETKFIEERKRQLNTFCQKIADLAYLHYSEEYQLFIKSSSADLDKTLAPFAKFSYEDLIAKYSSSFSHLSGKELNNETVMKIASFKVFLQKTQGYFENFKKIARSVSAAKRAYYQQFTQFHTQVCVEYEKNVFSEYHNGSSDKNVFGDPTNFVLSDRAERVKTGSTQPSLEYIYEWIKVESREIDAFIEAINQRDKYEGLKNKAQDKQRSDTHDLQKVLAGKTTIKTFFSRKPKEEEVGNLEKAIAQSGKDIEDLTMIHDMITLVVAYNEIDKFKGNKLDAYYQIVKLAAFNEFTNVQNMVDYWTNVLKNENVGRVADS